MGIFSSFAWKAATPGLLQRYMHDFPFSAVLHYRHAVCWWTILAWFNGLYSQFERLSRGWNEIPSAFYTPHNCVDCHQVTCRNYRQHKGLETSWQSCRPVHQNWVAGFSSQMQKEVRNIISQYHWWRFIATTTFNALLEVYLLWSLSTSFRFAKY